MTTLEDRSNLYKLDHIEEGKDGLISLINKYPEVTSVSAYDIGDCTLPLMEIETGEAQPISIPP